jgi:hypothetical protein
VTGDISVPVLANVEAEFGVIAVFLILSIFLRQEVSAESKPLGESDKATSETE